MLPRVLLFSLVTATVLPPIPLAPPAPPTPPNALAGKGYLLCDSPLEGMAVLATFHHILMVGGIKTLTVADVWGAQALKAGLRNGDRILKIQGKAVDGMNVLTAKLLIDPIGKKSVIPLQVMHPNAAHPVEIELPRGPQGGKA